MAEMLLCLKKKIYVVVPSFCFVKSFLCFLYLSFFFPSSDYVTGQNIVKCFHEYAMKKRKRKKKEEYEVLALCHSNSKSSNKV